MPEGMALKRENLGADLVAGLTTALVGLPQGMGYAIIAGINPIYGLYTAIFATIIGAFTTGSRFMNVAFSSALAVAVFSALEPVPEEDVLPSLFVLTLLVGIFQLTFGLLKLARLTRWISHPVITGFIAGLALLIILGQLGDLTGYYSDASNKIWQAWDLLFHLGQVHPATLAIGVTSILVVIVFRKTRLNRISLILGLIIPTIFIALVDWENVMLIGEEIPEKYRHLAYSIFAEKLKDVLRIEFFWGGGFPVKHTAYVYLSNGKPPDKETDHHTDWYWYHCERINDYWFRVSD